MPKDSTPKNIMLNSSMLRRDYAKKQYAKRGYAKWQYAKRGLCQMTVCQKGTMPNSSMPKGNMPKDSMPKYRGASLIYTFRLMWKVFCNANYYESLIKANINFVVEQCDFRKRQKSVWKITQFRFAFLSLLDGFGLPSWVQFGSQIGYFS